ncbi:hypothetical protein [Rhizobium leguminosarum]|uniref:hypothetical protein n=1 Tax=Rhizobium leguminosarum TaxID=384 RepID=UPI0013B96F25|nr:hypothetical protein [Rhizobium leguminosarum]NEI66480.1 hypothetical protein [Rhizobium leguminosarum]
MGADAGMHTDMIIAVNDKLNYGSSTVADVSYSLGVLRRDIDVMRERRATSSRIILKYILSAVFVTSLITPIPALAGTVTKLLGGLAPREDFLCGFDKIEKDNFGFDAVRFKRCKDPLFVLDIIAPPDQDKKKDYELHYEAYLESSDPADALPIFLLREFQAFATLQRYLRSLALHSSLGSTLYQEVNGHNCFYLTERVPYSQVNSPSVYVQGEHYIFTSADFEDSIRQDRSTCSVAYFKELSEETLSLSPIRTILEKLDMDLTSQNATRSLGKILLALETQRTDLTAQDIDRIEEGGWSGYPTSRLNGSYSSIVLNDRNYEVLDGFPGYNKYFANEETENAVVIGDDLQTLPVVDKAEPSRAQQANAEITGRNFASITMIANTMKLSDQWIYASGAASPELKRRSGTDIVLVANKIQLGEDRANSEDPTEESSFPAFAVQNRQGPIVFGSPEEGSDGGWARPGSLLLISPEIVLGRREVSRLRRVVNHFANIIAPGGLGSFGISRDEAMLFTRGLSNENPYRQSILSGNSIGLDAFISLWEAALEWQMKVDPHSILHRYIYVDGDDVIESSSVSTPTRLPLGEEPVPIDVERNFASKAIPKGSIERWVAAYVGKLRSDLNLALAQDDIASAQGVFAKLAQLLASKMPGLSSTNGDVAAMLAIRATLSTRVGVSEVQLAGGGYPSQTNLLTFAETDPLKLRVAPDKALLRVQDIGGGQFAGLIALNTTADGRRLQVIADVDLAVDDYVRSKVDRILSASGRTAVPGFPNWELSARKIAWAGVEASRVTQTSASNLHLELSLNPDQAGPFLAALTNEPGIPIVLDWVIARDPKANSANYGPITVSLSTRYRALSGVSVVSGRVSNETAHVYAIDYVCGAGGDCALLEPTLQIKPKESLELPSSVLALIPNPVIPPAAARIRDPDTDWLGSFYYSNTSIARSFKISNQMPYLERLGGVNKYVDVIPTCVTTDGKELYSFDEITLLPGEVRSVSCVRPEYTDVSLRLKGKAFFENGGMEELLTRDFSPGTIQLQQGLLPQ